MIIQSEYADYASYTKTCPLDSFKSHPRYTQMLEHVTPTLGAQYFNILKQECGMPDASIAEFCQLNDRIGNPNKQFISQLSLEVSGTSLRYLYHAWLVLKYMEPGSSIVEIGCGYGGLCLAIDYISKQTQRPVSSYACIDLDEAISLQKRYLVNFQLSFPVSFHSSSTYGSEIEGSNHFLVSNYCFSEIPGIHQRGYVRTLFPKISHGFMVWNHIPLYDFGKPDIHVEEERPLTGGTNLFISF